MNTDTWTSPIPLGCNARNYHVWRPGAAINAIANNIIDRAWRGRGVRLFYWPCGTCMLATVGSKLDRDLLSKALPALYGTYARGALLIHVLADLRAARRGVR